MTPIAARLRWVAAMSNRVKAPVRFETGLKAYPETEPGTQFAIFSAIGATFGITSMMLEVHTPRP